MKQAGFAKFMLDRENRQASEQLDVETAARGSLGGTHKLHHSHTSDQSTRQYRCYVEFKLFRICITVFLVA